MWLAGRLTCWLCGDIVHPRGGTPGNAVCETCWEIGEDCFEGFEGPTGAEVASDLGNGLILVKTVVSTVPLSILVISVVQNKPMSHAGKMA